MKNPEVTIKKTGFSPNDIYTVKGSRVTWVNLDNLTHWPASDPHPFHTGYPSKEKGCIGSTLDACRPLNTNESYSFVFDKVGTWGMHDHLYHGNTMTVRVYDNYFDLIKGRLAGAWNDLFRNNQKINLASDLDLNKLIGVCSSNPDRTKQISCYKESLQEAVKQYGVSVLMGKLEENYKKNDSADSGGITRCHDIAHAIGQAGVSVFKDPKAVLSQCTDLCTSGCFHGAVEEYVIQTSSDNFLSNMNNMCSSAACYHGLGHGLASIATFDLKKSLQLCDKLNDNSSKINCGFGVFMELYEPSSFNPVPLSIPSDLLAFCSDLTGVYLNVCYRNIGTYEYDKTRNIKKAFEICRAIPKDYGRECRVALGQATFFNDSGKADRIINTCENAYGEEFVDCIDGSIMASVSSDPLVRHGFEICSQIGISIKAHCFQILGEQTESTYGIQSRKQLCSQLTGQIYNYCLDQN